MRIDNIVKTGMIVLSAMMAGCSGVDDAHKFENKIFIHESTYVKDLRVQTDEKVNELSAEIVLSLAEPEDKDINVTLAPAPDLLDTYRKGYYDEDAVLLPVENYTVSSLTPVIPAGKMDSDEIQFDFKELLSLDYTRNYILPVTIESAGIDILESGRTLFFVIKEASLVNIVADISDNCAWPEWKDFDEVADMETFTMEALVKGTAFANKSKVHTIMGIEDNFLLRVGDDNDKPLNTLYLAIAGVPEEEGGTPERESVEIAKLDADKWYHIAVTFNKGNVKVYIDGKLRAEQDFSAVPINKTSVNFKVPHSDEMDGKPRCFWIGYSYDDKRSFNGAISEVRLWNKELSSEEINGKNHFYKISAPENAEGLVAYWKFNDGKGNAIKDWSKYGNDLTAASSIVWKNVELPAKE